MPSRHPEEGQHLEDDTQFVEAFIVESWAEHLRQHGRVTIADQDVEAQARAYHVGRIDRSSPISIAASAGLGSGE